MYDINPEFRILKKVPVITRPLQIELTRRYLGGLMKREASRYDNCSFFYIPSEASPAKKIGCLVYSPAGAGNDGPAVILFHGGAFVFPALPYHYRLARHIMESVNCRVFMPDYDLAPRAVPPVQQDEAREVYQYVLDNAGKYSVDPKRISIVGDSAGGTMCAALCLRLKKEGLQMPAAQALLYPSLDARLCSDSMKRYPDVPVCNSSSVKAYYKICEPRGNVLPDLEDRSPAEAASLEGMPPTYVETAEFDCLHDDGTLYASRLMDAGCSVILNETKGTVHAYDMAKNSSVLKKSMDERISFLRRAAT